MRPTTHDNSQGTLHRSGERALHACPSARHPIAPAGSTWRRPVTPTSAAPPARSPSRAGRSCRACGYQKPPVTSTEASISTHWALTVPPECKAPSSSCAGLRLGRRVSTCRASTCCQANIELLMVVPVDLPVLRPPARPGRLASSLGGLAHSWGAPRRTQPGGSRCGHRRSVPLLVLVMSSSPHPGVGAVLRRGLLSPVSTGSGRSACRGSSRGHRHRRAPARRGSAGDAAHRADARGAAAVGR